MPRNFYPWCIYSKSAFSCCFLWLVEGIRYYMETWYPTRLTWYGLAREFAHFIGNFLTDRGFQVHLGTILSDVFHQEEGVPQGAILSTTLFNVKINNIVKQVDPGVECYLYVDGFVIVYKSPTIDAIQRKLQHTINRLEKWTLKNGFTISKNKTIAMHFCPD